VLVLATTGLVMLTTIKPRRDTTMRAVANTSNCSVYENKMNMAQAIYNNKDERKILGEHVTLILQIYNPTRHTHVISMEYDTANIAVLT